MYARRVIAGVSGSAGSLQALRYAAEMARSDNAVLAPVLAWTPPGGELADRRAPCPELRRAWTQAAWDRLWRAIDLGIGGPPADLAFSPQIVRGQRGPGAQPAGGRARRRPRHRCGQAWRDAAADGVQGQQVLPRARALPGHRGAASTARGRSARTARLDAAASRAAGGLRTCTLLTPRQGNGAVGAGRGSLTGCGTLEFGMPPTGRPQSAGR